LRGRISKIGTTEEDSPIWIDPPGGEPSFRVYLKDVTSCKVVLPLFPAPSSKENTPEVTLCAHGEKFVVDRRRIEEAVPLVKSMLEKEPGASEIDVSDWASLRSLKQVFAFIDGKIAIEKQDVAREDKVLRRTSGYPSLVRGWKGEVL
jgi:hypothetical protein